MTAKLVIIISLSCQADCAADCVNTWARSESIKLRQKRNIMSHKTSPSIRKELWPYLGPVRSKEPFLRPHISAKDCFWSRDLSPSLHVFGFQ